MDKHIAKIKIYFVLLVIVMVIGIGGGGWVISQSGLLATDVRGKIGSFFKYVDYTIALSDERGVKAVAAAIESIFTDSQTQYAIGSGTARSVPILVYHGIAKEDDGSFGHITTTEFEQQMFALKKAGYDTVTSKEFFEYMRGDQSLPDKSLMITFDDGRSDSVKHADPILKALDYEAVMFVITQFSFTEENKNNYYIDTKQIKQMHESGRWDIQAHSDVGHVPYKINAVGDEGHYYTNLLWNESEHRSETDEEYENRIYKDLLSVKNKLDELLGAGNTIAFAFPFGDLGQQENNYPKAQEVLARTVNNMYSLAMYQNMPNIRFSANYFTEHNRGASHFFVRRFDPTHETQNNIIDILQDGQAKNLPYVDTFDENNGWILAWGDLSFEPNLMTLKAKSTQAGSASILDGTRLWENYDVRAVVEIPRRNGIYVWARFQDDQNNIACNLGRGFAHVQQTLNGKETVLRGIRNPEFILPSGDFEIGVRVNNRTVDCLVNGVVVVTTPFVDESLNQGGIGFKIWDTELGQSVLNVKSIRVDPIE